MKAHWLDESENTGSGIDAATLNAQGVHAERLDTDPEVYRDPINVLKKKHEYIQEDQIELKPDTPKIDEICAKFIDEHYHDEDEVRFVLAGEGVFDIRSTDDRWMRVTVETGDLIVVPAGRHHRFFLTDKKNIRCMRLFKDPIGWVPHYRYSSSSPASS